MNLYNKERPTQFSEMVGQEKIIKIISRDLVKGTPKQAYLFTGVRGTGKTTVARILAQSFNCSHPKADGSPCGECDSCKEIREGLSMDVYELDAASNNSVENIREILEKVQYKPIGKKKVFILDECHMLSNAASNALLKVLEEPPEDVVFILCTTEVHKVLPTIISRCSKYDFEKIPLAAIAEHLEKICNKNNVVFEKSALNIIAKAASGSMRDALSILDKFMSEGNIEASVVSDVLGIAPEEAVFSVLNAIAESNAATAVDAVRALSARGGNMAYFSQEVMETLLDMTDFQNTGDEESIIGDDVYREEIISLSYKMSTSRAFSIMDEFRNAYQQKADEFCMITAILASIQKECAISSLESEVEEMKKRIKLLEDNMGKAPMQANAASCDAVEEPDPMPDECGLSSGVTENTEGIGESIDYDASFRYEEDTGMFDCQETYSEANEQSSEPPLSNMEEQPSLNPSSTYSNSEDGFIKTGMSFDELASSVLAMDEENVKEAETVNNIPGETPENEPASENPTDALARHWDFFG